MNQTSFPTSDTGDSRNHLHNRRRLRVFQRGEETCLSLSQPCGPLPQLWKQRDKGANHSLGFVGVFLPLTSCVTSG